MIDIVPLIGNISILIGALIFATAGLGFIRFPDVFMRASAIGTAGGIGIILVVFGTLLQNPDLPSTLKVIVIIVIQLATAAVGSTAVARSALLTKTKMVRWSYDELDDEAVKLQSDARNEEPRD